MSDFMIESWGLTKTYGWRTALCGLDLAVGRGRIDRKSVV